jgi:pyruvate-ferredoxin/flavodoxin oxidoreductase
MGGRINSIMQTAFFAISGVLPRDEAIEQIKTSIRKTYGRKGEDVVQANFAAVDATLANLYPVPVPDMPTAAHRRPPMVPAEAPDFVQRVTAVMMAQQGDLLPVSAFPPDGTWPAGTSRWEKRNLADEIPVWDTALCIQCNKCVLVCPHSAIRAKVVDPGLLGEAPATFKSTPYRGPEFKGQSYLLQVAPEDCTGCSLCVHVCPAVDKKNPAHRAIDMTPQPPLRDAERENFAFFMGLPDPDRTKVRTDVKGTEFLRPLFEFSGACAGCGETPYVRLLTQLYGDRLLIANATGCSSIYGANLPTSPWTTDANGRGPAWSNSLFEDNAEFGFGMRLALDTQAEQARMLLRALAPGVGETLVTELLEAQQGDEAWIRAQRERVELLRSRLAGLDRPEARRLAQLASALVRKTVWIVGGDGWAYDIGYGGLDHVLAMGRDVNVLVLDTEVYSNTGGQQSKATPLGASARFAMAGKAIPKKDLGMLAMTYGTVYVAHVAYGAKDAQTVQALREAESYPGASLVIAYSPCINQGYDLGEHSLEQMRLAVESGYWPLYRYDPRRAERGLPPLQLDSPAPKVDLAEFMGKETRFRTVEAANPERAKALLDAARREIQARYALYEQLAHGVPRSGNGATAPVLAGGESGEKQ